LNGAAGSLVRVCPETVRLVSCALDGWRRTEGDFDPTLIDDLMSAGYDRTFAEVRANTTNSRSPAARATRARVSPDAIVIDAHGSNVALPHGTGFDPGGIGKGLAADIVAEEAIDAGARAVCVDVGGDIRIAHSGSRDVRWPIQIEGSGAPTDQKHAVALRNGGVATSSPSVRRWEIDGVEHHHLLDPRTGRSLETPIDLVTVIAGSAWQADVLTKAVFVRGARQGCVLVTQLGAAARVCMSDGSIITTDSWADFAS
jgi:thiamine biosynthesis lipoprotein